MHLCIFPIRMRMDRFGYIPLSALPCTCVQSTFFGVVGNLTGTNHHHSSSCWKILSSQSDGGQNPRFICLSYSICWRAWCVRGRTHRPTLSFDLIWFYWQILTYVIVRLFCYFCSTWRCVLHLESWASAKYSSACLLIPRYLSLSLWMFA